MTHLQIPMDPLNPGQFFACCGLFELFALHCPDACAAFDPSESAPRRAAFSISGAGLPALSSVLDDLRSAQYSAAPGSGSVQAPISPISAGLGTGPFLLDWWLTPFWDDVTILKCWAGQVTTRKLFEDLPAKIEPTTEPQHLMFESAQTNSKFGVDPRSAWNALDFGFSPIAQGLDSATYPAVEVLAAFGLQGFRPDAEQRSAVPYYLWTVPLSMPVARLAAVAAWTGLPRFEYTFSIAKRGQSYKFFEFAKFQERKVYYA